MSTCPNCNNDQVTRSKHADEFLMISRTSHLVFNMVAFSCCRCFALWYVIGRCADATADGVILYDEEGNYDQNKNNLLQL